MLDPSDIAPFSTSNGLQNCPFSSSDHGSQQVNQDPSHQQLSSHNANTKTSRSTSLMNYWKKQIKRYMRSLRKQQSRKSLKNVCKQLSLVLNLLKPNPQINNQYAGKSKSRSYWRQLTPFCAYFPSRRMKSQTFLVLSPLCSSFTKQKIFFELTVLGVSGKIQYNAIVKKSSKEIQKKILQVESCYIIKSRFIQEKNEILQLISSKETEFRDMIDSFHDFEQMLFQNDIQGSVSKELDRENDNERQENLCNNSKQILKLYSFLKGEVWNKVLKKLPLEESLQKWAYCPLIYNLLKPLVDSTSVPLVQQILDDFESLETLTTKFVQEQMCHSEDIVENIHLPGNLVNAHLCLNCKKHRGYISCQSCSRKEGKTIALCFQCYKIYHQHLNRQFQVQQKDILFDKWHTFNSNTTVVVDIQIHLRQDPQENRLKQEQ